MSRGDNGSNHDLWFLELQLLVSDSTRAHGQCWVSRATEQKVDFSNEPFARSTYVDANVYDDRSCPKTSWRRSMC